jgi:hypothetical protein
VKMGEAMATRARMTNKARHDADMAKLKREMEKLILVAASKRLAEPYALILIFEKIIAPYINENCRWIVEPYDPSFDDADEWRAEAG